MIVQQQQQRSFLSAAFQDNLRKPIAECQTKTIMHFAAARDEW